MHTLRRLGVVLLGVVLLLGTIPMQADSPAQERIPLTYGQTVTGFIDDTGFFQQYSFEGAAGDAVVITMDRVNGNLDPLLLLGDVSLNLIAEDDDGGSEFNARLELILPADGTYVIEATRYGQQEAGRGGTGEYRLTLIANQVGGSGGVRRGGLLSRLDFGGTERGLLNAEDPFHLFWFQAQAGDTITAQSALGGGLSAALFFYDDRFSLLASDPAGGAVTASLERPGVYFVALARTAESGDGTYALTLSGNVTLEDTVLDLPPVPLAYGQQIQGVITDQRPLERYTFIGAANDQALLRMGALGSELDAFIYLYGPNGEIIGQDDDSAGNRNAELAVVLPLEGEYTVLATRFGRENGPTTGAYVFSLSLGTVPVDLENVAPDTEPQGSAGAGVPANFIGLPQISYGNTVGGTVDAQGYYQFYVFEASANDQIVISMARASGDLDTFIQLLNANTETIAQNDDLAPNDTDSRLEYTIPQSGYYAIFATRFEVEAGTTTGDFVLSLNATTAARTTGVIDLLPTEELLPEATASGQLGQNVASLYRFTAAAGDSVDLTLSANDLLQPEVVLALMDADLNEVAVGLEGSLTHTVTQTGAYLALVTRRSGPLSEAGGIFNLSLSGTTPFVSVTPVPVVDAEAAETATVATDIGSEAVETGAAAESSLAYGQVVTGELSDEREEYEFTFTAQTGDRLSIVMDSIDATLDPLLLVLDPEGSQIIRDDNSGGNFNARVDAYLVTASGQYTIIATRTQGRGTFQLTLDGIPVSQPTVDVEGRRVLTLGQTVSGQISDDSAATIYAFQAEAGAVVQIIMTTASGDLDPYVALLDANQNLAAQDDDSGGNRNARLVYSILTSGWHYIVATRFEFAAGTTSGEYLLSLTSD